MDVEKSDAGSVRVAEMERNRPEKLDPLDRISVFLTDLVWCVRTGSNEGHQLCPPNSLLEPSGLGSDEAETLAAATHLATARVLTGLNPRAL